MKRAGTHRAIACLAGGLLLASELVYSSAPAVPPVRNLQCYRMRSVANGTELTIAYPEGFNDRLDLFACTDLARNEWSLICTTNIDSTANHICITDTNATNMPMRFYTTWNADDDGDLDGLNDGRETLLYGTSATSSDTDNDSLPDGWEVAHSLNPLIDDGSGDLDSDNLVNTNEYLCGTCPDDKDTDDDGWSDGWEVANAFDPLDDTDPDNAVDYDKDGLSTAEEAVLGTDPVLFDSDSDGLWDKWEIQTGFNPLMNDTDDILQTGETIQQMINASSPGDILVVPVGTCSGSGNRDIQYNGKSITLISANGPENTTVACENVSRGFTFDDSEGSGSILNGFTITGGNATNGGGIYCYGSSPIIRNCIITHNRAIEYGGGIYCVPETISTTDYIGSQPVIENCRIERNSAPCGGGIRSIDYEDFADFASYTRTAPKLANSIISWNSATKTGGGISCFRSQFILENSAVMNNMTDTNSPGIEVNYGEMIINSSVISGNTAPNAKNGAGVYSIHYYYNPVFGSEYIGETDIRNTIIHDNSPVTNQICEYEYYAWPRTSHCSVNYSAYNGSQTSWLDPYGYSRNVVTINSPTCVTTADPGITHDGHLTASSTNLFNEGQKSTATPFDKDGERRGASVDIGLDEYVETESTPDSLPDWFEDEYFGSTNSAQTGSGDPDGDGLSNKQEYIAGTSPLHNDDRDLDGLSDDDEICRGTDPANPDTDGDGLTDGYEVNTSNTDPKYWDSDGDEMSDGWEDAYDLDPNDATGDDGATGNTDGDNWNNKKEYDQGSNPGSSDTDGDGQPDHNDADPTNADDNRAASGNTTDITMTIGDSSGSHSERYHMVILGSRYELYMPKEGVVVDKTITVPKGKTMHGYIESDYDDDEDGDYDAEVSGADVTVRPPEDMETLGGHHENSGFNYGQRYFTIDVGTLGVEIVGDYDYNNQMTAADEVAGGERPLLLDAGSPNRVMVRITGFPDAQESGYIRLQATKTGTGEIKVYDAATGGNLLIDLTSGSPVQTSWTLSSGKPITVERYVYLEGVTASSAYGDIVLRTWWDDGSSQESPKDKLLVNVVKVDIAMDGNRDDTIDFDDPDDAEYLFWVNDDHDCLHYEEREWHEDDSAYWASGAPGPNCDDDRIGGKGYIDGNPPSSGENHCRRDLEDFTRLHVRVDDITANMSGITYWMKFENPTSGSPSINIFEAINEDLDYLQNGTIADQQIQKTKLITVGSSEVQLSNQYIKTGDQRSPFILEGKTAGKGDLTIIIKKDGSEVCRKAVTLDLRPITAFYEKYVVTVSAGDDVNTTSGGNANSTTYTPETDAYVLHVHGWNMGDWEKDRWTETVFKRLWWQNYKGHVGSFQWPTYTGLLSYDASELRAWRSGEALKNRITSLNSTYSGQVRVIAHSMGNVVMGEALRIFSSSVVHTYIAAQAAIPAHCYDNTVTNYWSGFDTPNIYARYSSGMSPDTPYLAANSGHVGAMILYFNPDDYALGALAWQLNNEMKPDVTYWYTEGDTNIDSYAPGSGDRFYYDSVLPFDERTLSIPDDRFEIFARIVEARSRALGCELSVSGFGTARNLKDWGYDNLHYSHSREFRSNIIDEQSFWTAVRMDANINE